MWLKLESATAVSKVDVHIFAMVYFVHFACMKTNAFVMVETCVYLRGFAIVSLVASQKELGSGERSSSSLRSTEVSNLTSHTKIKILQEKENNLTLREMWLDGRQACRPKFSWKSS